MLCRDVDNLPPGGQDGNRDPARVREMVARVVKEAVDRTDRSPRKVGELLHAMGFSSPKKPGEPYSDSSVRAWMKQVDRPLAEVIVALALHLDLSLDAILWGTGLRDRVKELEELVFGLVRHTGYDAAELAGRTAAQGD